jgi:hypothetical protein
MQLMSTFLEACFHVVNLPATLFLLLILLYWTTVIFGVMDLSTLDVDLPDVDVDAGDAGGDSIQMEGMLEYFNIRYVPASIVISLFGLSLWVISMVANELLNPANIGLIGLGIFVANLLVSSHIAKFASAPLVPLFKGMREQSSASRDLIGSTVVVTSSKVDSSFGQAEISGDGPEITLSVRTEGEEILLKGTEAVILHQETETEHYIITSLEISS